MLPPALFNFYKLFIGHQNKIIKLNIWDTCELEKNINSTISFIESASLLLFVYAINNEDSFEALDTRINIYKNNYMKNAKLFLVGNKIDIPENE